MGSVFQSKRLWHQECCLERYMNRNFVKTRLILMATGIALLSASGHLLNGAEATITRTNWAERWITNVVDILMPRNIFIDEYHTNWIEQWRTNVVNRYATNIIPTEVAAPKAVRESKEARVTGPASMSIAALTEDLVLEAAMTGRRVTNYVEVQLKVHWANDHDAPVLVQQWRAEREDGVILSFGQEQIFKRLLPAGKYKVEVRAQREANSP